MQLMSMKIPRQLSHRKVPYAVTTWQMSLEPDIVSCSKHLWLQQITQDHKDHFVVYLLQGLMAEGSPH